MQIVQRHPLVHLVDRLVDQPELDYRAVGLYEAGIGGAAARREPRLAPRDLPYGLDHRIDQRPRAGQEPVSCPRIADAPSGADLDRGGGALLPDPSLDVRAAVQVVVADVELRARLG